ncbi:N-acetylmuramoyl-L-alanine amidase [Streptomyces sp. NPDC014894]|uniref:N-acetylmuramoyl-L-alanine amidase n=1 Tax=unclassified Streptomyces TaxID=2593676 RepID=UPI0036F8B5B4
MSYDEMDRPRRRRPGAPAIAAAVLVPAAALAGWLAMESVNGAPESGPPPATKTAGETPGEKPGGKPGEKPREKPGESSDDGKPGGREPLKGRTVVVDPGHNPGNFRHTDEINAPVDIGTNRKPCDATGTSTDDGYTEAAFTRDVSHRLRALLEEQGARVVFTHDGERPFGPCVDERARIGNAARADAVVSVHADGSARGHRGFHLILPGPVRAGAADTGRIVGPSRELGERIAGAFGRATGTDPSNYAGGGTGLDVRTDLGGLNLSTVPKVFIECGNMRDPADAALLTSAGWRQRAAQGIADGLRAHLTARPGPPPAASPEPDVS